ncbi:MAG: Cobalt/magnesium transport protein CorA [Chlamydiia bacterium]|nr:Cobalt/magnesium transport protein CorA [Chlamydiia bacterium]MCH9617997.1 Cobalt/magnesium transport protein CorA [Chlamydiia bacterium]MCH9623678.1 Cobalt/magnesium transport protein CorA [Chlamydiia bacterium]
MTKYYLKNTHEKVFQNIPSPQQNCLIHADNADDRDLVVIADLLELDIDEITDSLDLMEIPRVEKLNKTTFAIFVRFPSMEESGVYTSPLTIIISENYFVTISPTKSPIIERIINASSEHRPAEKTEFLVHILLKIIQNYTRVIKKIRTEVVIHEKNLTKFDEKAITELTQKEENLNQCLNALQPLRKVINALLTRKFATLEEDDQDDLEDLLLGSEQAEALCELSLRIITSLRNSVQVVITDQFNKTIKLLTALTIILNFPTIISSIYGMNVELPFQHSPWAFEIVMSFIVVSIVGSLYYFQKRKWL